MKTQSSDVGTLVILFLVSGVGAAHADVGSPPKCPSGTYHAYLMGHRCVKDGYRLEQDADGKVQEAPIPGVTSTPPPASGGSAPTTPNKTSGCTMGASRSAPAPTTALCTMGLLLMALRRRFPSSRLD